MEPLAQDTARRIIEVVYGSGQPPEYGFQYFTAGLEQYLEVIETEYLASFIKQGGGTFKLVVGGYGGGKTHFLYCVRDIAWKHNFVVSYVSLGGDEAKFEHLDQVYRAVVRGMMPPVSEQELLSDYERGIESFMRSWYSEQIQAMGNLSVEERRTALKDMCQQIHLENIGYARAVRGAFLALLDEREEDFENICQWLAGEGYVPKVHRTYGILQKIDKNTAATMIRSLIQWVRQIGYSGLVVLFDEADTRARKSSKDQERHLANLRELVDESGQSRFRNVMIFYAVPNLAFLQLKGSTYEALKQRLATTFQIANPTGIKIDLKKEENQINPFLMEVGGKLLEKVYTKAYRGFDLPNKDALIKMVAEEIERHAWGEIGCTRLFVQKIIWAFNSVRSNGRPPTRDELKKELILDLAFA